MSQTQQALSEPGGNDVPEAGKPHRTLQVLSWLKHEFIEILPAIVYFFVAFNILILNERLILEQHGIRLVDFVRPAIGALLVAKLLIVVNMLPFINAFPNKPLIWNTIWKAMIYWIGGIVLQVLESLIEVGFKSKSLSVAYQQTIVEVQSPHFVVVQMWLFVLLLMFVALQELGRVLGPGKVSALFFGWRTAAER